MKPIVSSKVTSVIVALAKLTPVRFVPVANFAAGKIRILKTGRRNITIKKRKSKSMSGSIPVAEINGRGGRNGLGARDNRVIVPAHDVRVGID